MKITTTIKGVEFEIGFEYRTEASINIYEINHHGTDFFDFFGDELDIVDDAIRNYLTENSENELARKEEQGERRAEELRHCKS